jgi:transposase
MKITNAQYEKIAKYLPVQRGNVKISNLQLINAILYVAENGCKWRALPKEYGNWHTVYVRLNRWSKNGVLERVFKGLQAEGIIKVRVNFICLDSTTVKVHPDACGALKKNGKQAIGRSRGGITTKIHMVTASDRAALTFSLSGGEKNDSPEGIKLLYFTPYFKENKFLLMDRAYQGDNMRLTAENLGYEPVVPPKSNRLYKWDYDKELYKLRNVIERFFRRIKRFRRICTRYDKLDSLYSGFILFSMIVDSLM